jgi:two-component system, cell cycle sensor histidine kinase and response regulator CckA
MAVVLVVDDDAVVARLTAEILRSAGYDVHTANDPTAALELAHEHEVDVVVTDVVLGRTDGLDLVESLREIRPAAKTIFMSGYGAYARAAPGDPVLAKPFTPDELRSRVADALAT